MSIDYWNISWFTIFILLIFIAFIGNLIIILAILKDKTMHTSTYFYIINVSFTDIILVLTCLPERISAVFYSDHGFQLGLYICYFLPFLQQVSMQAALGFLLILTLHRCYPAGVPRCLQRDLIRRQIRNHSKTSCIIWLFAILINLPLFLLTKYETYNLANQSNLTFASCDTEARETWSRTYLILILVLTYLITGIFLIVIYGQVIRIIVHSNKFRSTKSVKFNGQYNFLTRNFLSNEKRRQGQTSTSSLSMNASNLQRNFRQSTNTYHLSVSSQFTSEKSSSINSRSTQHLQVIVMVFTVILLYILLLLPYRLLNLLFIVSNELFQHDFMNELFFQCLIHIVRLLVFLNCALQPIIYLIISSRLRQTVQKFFDLTVDKFCCYCRCPTRHTPTTNFPLQIFRTQRINFINERFRC